MLLPPFQRALVLTGPTGSGKSQFALHLATKLDAEIISMDSMALYRGMDIGTAKPTHAERAVVRHHLIDVLEPWESASVAWWLEQARACVAEIESRGKQALFVGGTPLYLKALLSGLFDGQPAEAAVRERLKREAEEHGSSALHARLATVDPASAARLHPNDRRRLIRALEIFELTGEPISAWQTQWGRREDAGATSSNGCLWLDVPRPVLYERINRRVVEMFDAGLVEEVKALMRLEKPLSPQAKQALGYKEVMTHLDGGISREETILRVQTRTRQFAKRQITWFRHLSGVQMATRELTESLWQIRMKA